VQVVKLACERPETAGRSLSQWDCLEIRRQLIDEGLVDSIGRESIRRILAGHQLKPWRVHAWLSPKVPRDEAFGKQVEILCDLSTRELEPHEMVLCMDEMTSLQPRPRSTPTRPAVRGRPVQYEHEYSRCGAVNLFAAFDTRSGHVWGTTARRKRQVELIQLLEKIDGEAPAEKTLIHVVLDNVSTHHGQLARQWLADHRRFRFAFPPVHCSWMNQVEQWFSILRRKRLRIVDFRDLDHLQQSLHQFIAEWNEVAHPFRWTTKSFAKVMAKCENTCEPCLQVAA
jgi:transposase